MTVVEIERRGGGTIAPDGAGKASASPREPDRMIAAREDGGRRRPPGPGTGRVETGRHGPHEIEHAAAGGLTFFGAEGAFAGRRNISREVAYRFHRRSACLSGAQCGFTVLASVIGGARFMAPLSS